jgi:hypothetical protein
MVWNGKSCFGANTFSLHIIYFLEPSPANEMKNKNIKTIGILIEIS